MNTIKEWQEAVHANAKAHGFHEGALNVPEKLCLIHSEVSEALESHRSGHPDFFFMDGYLNTYSAEEAKGVTEEELKPEGIAAELADVVIRVMDLCGAMDIDLEAVMRLKHEYNVSRPYKHGKRY